MPSKENSLGAVTFQQNAKLHNCPEEAIYAFVQKAEKMSAPLFTLGCISPAAMRLQLLIYRVSRAIVTRCGVCNVYSSSDLAQNVIEGF